MPPLAEMLSGARGEISVEPSFGLSDRVGGLGLGFGGVLVVELTELDEDDTVGESLVDGEVIDAIAELLVAGAVVLGGATVMLLPGVAAAVLAALDDELDEGEAVDEDPPALLLDVQAASVTPRATAVAAATRREAIFMQATSDRGPTRTAQ